MNEQLQYYLESLEMIGDSNPFSGLVPVQDIKYIVDLRAEEIIAIENASKYKANYVYFRRFKDRPSVAQIYLYDYTENLSIDQTELINLHKQLYSSGHVPMFFIFTKKDVIIFNCFERPSDGNELIYKPLATISIAAQLSSQIEKENSIKLRDFSGKSFDNGSFWENSHYSKEFQLSNSAYEKLLFELKQALIDIIENNILPDNFARKIMVLSILIKYLEEREDEKQNRVFPDNFFRKFADNANKFTDVLNEKGSYLRLLDYLAEHFNGGIFKLEEEEREFLSKTDLTRFGLFLNGDLDGIQLVFWRLYSFNDLPVELISNIYEEFLGKEPGVVYTPPYLVNFLLDEAMPLTSENLDFKVLDPACGSGVFLVGAYRRLIYRWRKGNNWKNPDLGTLKSLLKNNIFGVELKKDAADLTVFSLSLALCDELSPLQIWHDLKFDNLREQNILNEDFFDVLSKSNFENKFNLIIGNPPFEAKLTLAAQKAEKAECTTRIITNLENGIPKDIQVKLPDNQIALLFLEQSMKLTKAAGLLCMIQPAGPLLYNNSSNNFRRSILEKYNVPQIVDFTPLSEILFGNAKVATAAIFIQNINPNNRDLLHIIARRTKIHKEKIYFELDAYDFYTVSQNEALNDPYVWKSNFLGGGRANSLIRRLSKLQTFGQFLENKRINDNWIYSEGFTEAIESDLAKLESLRVAGTKSIEAQTKYRKFEEKLSASFLTGKKSFPVKSFEKNGIKEEDIIDQLNIKFFHSKGAKEVYNAPHLLIKEVVDKTFTIPVQYRNDDIVFKNSIFGIHSKSKIELLEIESRFNGNKLFPYYLAATSGRFMINKSSSLLLSDIKSLPFPDQKEEAEIDEIELVIVNDFFKYLLEYRRKGEGAQIAKNDANENDLIRFSDIYCKILGSVFKTISPYQWFETDSFICFPFYFGEEPKINFSNSKESEKDISKLVEKNLGVSLRITRIIRLYEGNVIYLIKPKKLKYWLPSIALRDADETFSDLRKQGF